MAITFPDSIWTTYSWPYPRVWFMQHYNVAVAVYNSNLCLFELEYDMAAETWDAYYMCLLGAQTSIDQIDFGDFGMYYTVSVVGHDSDGVPYGNAWERVPNTSLGCDSMRTLPTDNMPSFICSCNFGGQIVVGGILDFDTYLTGIVADPQYSYVWWSGVGSHEFRPNCDPTAGFLNAPWLKGFMGEVLSIERLGQGVVAYGDYGKLLLTHALVESTSTFGYKKLEGSGIDSGNHMSGDENVHGYIDTNNEFWLATRDHKFQKLGYKEYIESMTKSDIVMSYVPQKKKFFFSDGVKGFCLTEYGLYSINQLVTGVTMQKEIV